MQCGVAYRFSVQNMQSFKIQLSCRLNDVYIQQIADISLPSSITRR